jgi:hypothetical protein
MTGIGGEESRSKHMVEFNLLPACGAVATRAG